MHLRMGRRHVRLCTRTPGAESFAVVIRPVLDRLTEKELLRVAAEEAREEAYDEAVRCDYYLDNAVRSTFEDIRQHDRDHLTRMGDLIFPDRGYSYIIRMTFSDKLQEVNKIIEKITALGETHPLNGLIAGLHGKMKDVADAFAAYEAAGSKLSGIQASEEIERLEVRRQYEHNWLDARKQYGASIAQSIFPKIRGKTPAAKPTSNEEPTPDKE